MSTLPLKSAAPPVSRWQQVDGWLERAGEYLNPILVKEARQALKSKQFLITFALVLLAGWVWSLAGVMIAGPTIYYGTQGPQMFLGYYLIVSVPLLVIVPFGAFRSLGSEREDGTFELVSVTTLKPRQIVGGKLGSAVLQMLIYLSAISPCLAFTYLLQGVELPTIAMVLVLLVLASIAYSVVGLFLATLTSARHWQSVLSVLFVIGLVMSCAGSGGLAEEALRGRLFSFQSDHFWIGLGMIGTAYLAYVPLCFAAASARLTFDSDNRSTVIRAMIQGHAVLFAGWTFYVWWFEENRDIEVLVAALALAMFHWFLFGGLVVGEHPQISRRVRRSLPQSFLGRAMLTWFSPGPGTGYMFAVANLSAMALPVIAVAAYAHWAWSPPGLKHAEAAAWFAILGVCYVTLYMGLGWMLVRLGRRFARVDLHLSLLLTVLVTLAGVSLPMFLDFLTNDMRLTPEYSLWQLPNPLWTLAEQLRNRAVNELSTVHVVIPTAALVVFALNLPHVAREVRQIRIARPQRVAEDDAEQQAREVPRQRTSPWDEDQAGGL